MPVKRSKTDDAYRRKAEELERKLENIQKSRTPEKKEKTGKSILGDAFGALTTKKIPLETPEGKVIESKKPQSVDF
jgi:hypothetical protein